MVKRDEHPASGKTGVSVELVDQVCDLLDWTRVLRHYREPRRSLGKGSGPRRESVS